MFLLALSLLMLIITWPLYLLLLIIFGIIILESFRKLSKGHIITPIIFGIIIVSCLIKFGFFKYGSIGNEIAQMWAFQSNGFSVGKLFTRNFLALTPLDFPIDCFLSILNVPKMMLLRISLTLLQLGTFLLGLFFLIKKKEWTLVTWSLFLVPSLALIGIVMARYYILVLPIHYLIVTWGLIFLEIKFPRRIIYTIGAFLLILNILFSLSMLNLEKEFGVTYFENDGGGCFN